MERRKLKVDDAVNRSFKLKKRDNGEVWTAEGNRTRSSIG